MGPSYVLAGWTGLSGGYITRPCGHFAWIAFAHSSPQPFDARPSTVRGRNGGLSLSRDAEDIVVVRVYYVWTLFTPLLNTSLKTLSGGKRLISSTVSFRNEPWAT
jgi:hypothetical protein